MTGRLDEGRPGGLLWPERLKTRGMSLDLINLLASCFEDEPEHRVADARVLADAIAALLAPEPKTAADYLARGNAHYGCKDYDGAIADYDQAIRLDPKYTTAYINRGLARKAKGDLDGAIADSSRPSGSTPSTPPPTPPRHVDSTRLRRAIADYDQAIRLDPKDATAYNNRGSARYDRKEYDGAIADYDQAIRLDPKYATAYNNRGSARDAKGLRRGDRRLRPGHPARPQVRHRLRQPRHRL